MCMHPLLWLLFNFNLHKWNCISSPVTYMMWLRNSSPFLWCHSKENQNWSHSLHYVHTCEHFQNNPSCAQLVIAEPVIISQRTVGEIFGNSQESSEIVKRHLLQIFWATLWARSSLTADCRLLRSSLWTLIQTFFSILCHCLTVPSLITFWP
jgi:hypothetical protein